jgi:uncharacterized membrane protein
MTATEVAGVPDARVDRQGPEDAVTPDAEAPAGAPVVRRRNPATASAEWISAHPTVQRARGALPRQGPEIVLTFAMVWWLLTFAQLVTWRHDRFASFDFDLGVWDQLAWLFAHGGSLSTVRGLPSFGFHATPALFVYVPFYWLGAGANFLNQTMVAAVCIAAVPVYRIARHHLRNDWHALVPALAFLVNFAAQWLMQETFHPEVMAIPFLLFAYLASLDGRWRAFAVWLALALLWKEDIALAGTMLGLVLVTRGTLHRGALGRLRIAREEGGTSVRVAAPGAGDRLPALTRRAGLLAMAGCFAYFVFATQWWLPHFSHAGNFTEVGWFGDLGNSSLEILRSMVTRPDLVSAHLQKSDPGTYFSELGGSFGFISLLSPLPLLIGFPQAAINLLTVQNFFWPTRVHYAVVPLVAITIASTEGLARFKWLPLRRFLLGVMAAATFFTAISWGVGPLSNDYKQGYWPLEVSAAQPRLDAAVALPGPGDGVSAMYYLVPHMTHRFDVYTFPNPWIANNWGVNGENRPDPEKVDWLMVNPSSFTQSDLSTLASVLSDPHRLLEPAEVAGIAPAPATDLTSVTDPRRWQVVTDEPDLFIARRVRG